MGIKSNGEGFKIDSGIRCRNLHNSIEIIHMQPLKEVQTLHNLNFLWKSFPHKDEVSLGRANEGTLL